jgi:fructose-1,6-bisphosphatase
MNSRLATAIATATWNRQEQCGGATDGGQSLLDVDPDELHATVPTLLRSKPLVERVEAAGE